MQLGKQFCRLSLMTACLSQTSLSYASEMPKDASVPGQLLQAQSANQLAQSGGRAGVNGSPIRYRKSKPVGSLHLILSLAWEGRDLRPENLSAIDSLRKRFAHLKVMHFISPAYFLRDTNQRDTAVQAIKQRILPGDSVGLLLNGWKSITMGAGVDFRADPTFWGSPLRDIDCEKDCGLEVPVHVYPGLDLAKMIQFGVRTLELHGLGRPVAIQSSGWVTSPQILESAVGEGMRYDFSAVPTALIQGRTRYFPLLSWVTDLWGHIVPMTEPYTIGHGPNAIIEVPQTLAAIDYLAEQDITAMIKPWLALAVQRGKSERQTTVTLGLYQETSDIMRAMAQKILHNLHVAAFREKIIIKGSTLPSPDALGEAPLVSTANPDTPTPVAHATNPTTPPTVEPPIRKPGGNMLREPPKVH